MLDVRRVQDLSVVEGVQEEGLLRQPAQRKRQHDDDEHFYNLKDMEVIWHKGIIVLYCIIVFLS